MELGNNRLFLAKQMQARESDPADPNPTTQSLKRGSVRKCTLPKEQQQEMREHLSRLVGNPNGFMMAKQRPAPAVLPKRSQSEKTSALDPDGPRVSGLTKRSVSSCAGSTVAEAEEPCIAGLNLNVDANNNNGVDEPSAAVSGWYWKDDEDCWQPFDIAKSENIESFYAVDRRLRFKMVVEPWTYVVDLALMTQTNTTSRRSRCIQRVGKAPTKAGEPHSPGNQQQNADTRRQTVAGPTPTCPESWDDDSVEPDYEWKLVDLDDSGKTADAYAEVVGQFQKTMPADCWDVVSVKRVQNPDMLAAFEFCRKRLQKKRGSAIDVRLLFHGTNGQFLDAICQQGFDCRLTGRSTGTIYGKGNYFARDAIFSHTYVTGCQKMFLVQVIVGDFVKGESSLVRPPPKDRSKPLEDLYDTCVDNISDPKVFVTFERSQSYPKYLIEYRDK